MARSMFVRLLVKDTMDGLCNVAGRYAVIIQLGHSLGYGQLQPIIIEKEGVISRLGLVGSLKYLAHPLSRKGDFSGKAATHTPSL